MSVQRQPGKPPLCELHQVICNVYGFPEDTVFCQGSTELQYSVYRKRQNRVVSPLVDSCITQIILVVISADFCPDSAASDLDDCRIRLRLSATQAWIVGFAPDDCRHCNLSLSRVCMQKKSSLCADFCSCRTHF